MQNILAAGRSTERTDVVFDTSNLFNKECRACAKIERYSPFQKYCAIKQDSAMGTIFIIELIKKFICSEWNKEHNSKSIVDKSFYVTCNDKRMELSSVGSADVPELKSDQEEADTRMLLQAQHASQIHTNIMIHSPDVFVIALEASTKIHANLFMKTGMRRMLNESSALVV